MRYKYDLIQESYYESVNMRSADEVKALMRVAVNIVMVMPGSPFFSAELKNLPTRKNDVSQLIIKLLSSDEVLKAVYEQLNELEQAAVQEAVHHPDGMLEVSRFRAKYGRLPGFEIETSGKGKGANPLSLLISVNNNIPHDLRKRLLSFVPKPGGVTGNFIDDLPEEIEHPDTSYYRYDDKPAKIPINRHDTEQAALHDIISVLQLISQGKIGASGKTGIVTRAGARLVREVLLHGDFYPEGAESKWDYDVRMGESGIRPFAWPMILQAGKLARGVEGSKLKITRKGEAAMTRPPVEVLRDLFEEWIKNTLFHEMNRIDIIKGQKSRSRPLSSASDCRAAIKDALSKLPAGKWVETEEFFRFLIAHGCDFNVARNPWSLYVTDREYGSFGYSHIKWGHLNGRFTRAFLLEYAATIGVIDVALIPPWGAATDIRDLWGTDNLSCLSRYDGLKYIRLTPLGAWILGKKETYQPEPLGQDAIFRLLPNMDIAILTPNLQPSDRLFLERIGERTSERVWKLTRDKILQSIERGLQMNMIEEFLASRNDGDIPREVDVFLSDIKNRIHKLRYLGQCTLIECDDSHTATLLANDSRLKKFCIPCEGRYLMIREGYEDAFRRVVREMGFVLPPGKS